MDEAKFNPEGKKILFSVIELATMKFNLMQLEIDTLLKEKKQIIEIGVEGQRRINDRQYQEKLLLKRKLDTAIMQRDHLLGLDTVGKEKMNKELEAVK